MQISETLSGMPHKLTCCFTVGDLKTSIHFFFFRPVCESCSEKCLEIIIKRVKTGVHFKFTCIYQLKPLS